MRNAIRAILLRIPQEWIPIWLENRYFTFNEVASRSNARGRGGL